MRSVGIWVMAATNDAHASAITTTIDAVIDVQWSRFGEPGVWMTGAQTVDVLRLALRPDAANASDDPASEAASLVAHRAASTTADSVEQLESRGLRREHFVEIVGVVSRGIAIDTYERGIGRTPRDLPTPRPGPPSGDVVAGARRRAGWVPTVGAIGPPTALDAVPPEADAQEALHGALYLSYAEMGDLHAASGLTRAQMELVAARVSYLNDCLF